MIGLTLPAECMRNVCGIRESGAPIMIRLQRIAISLCLILLTMWPFLTLRNRKQAEAAREHMFGRYTQQQFIDSCRPLLSAIVPDRDDFYVTADPISGRVPDDSTCLQWQLDAQDGKGNQLVHIVCDANTGLICLAGCDYNVYSASSPAHRLTEQDLTEQEAIMFARKWMRKLGYTENWFVVGTPHQSRKQWQVLLHSRMMKAQINVNKRTGSLTFARMTP
jgi:hypothetical protein